MTSKPKFTEASLRVAEEIPRKPKIRRFAHSLSAERQLVEVPADRYLAGGYPSESPGFSCGLTAPVFVAGL
jgi:hypothetical protein